MASTTEFMMELRPKAMGNADQQAHDVVTTSYARWVDKFQIIYAHARPYRTGDSNDLKMSLKLPYGSFISFTDYFSRPFARQPAVYHYRNSGTSVRYVNKTKTVIRISANSPFV